jgi:hypothetical protein
MSLALRALISGGDNFMDDNAIELTDEAIDALLLGASNASPRDRKKLKGLLKYYAKKAHPFRACVRDNTKRFGPDGAARICATLKDIIRGTTKWRGKNNPRDKGTAGIKNLSEEGLPYIDPEFALLLSEITDENIARATAIMEGGGGKE